MNCVMVSFAPAPSSIVADVWLLRSGPGLQTPGYARAGALAAPLPRLTTGVRKTQGYARAGTAAAPAEKRARRRETGRNSRRVLTSPGQEHLPAYLIPGKDCT